MKTPTCALVLAVLVSSACAEDVWITFVNHKGELDKGKVVSVNGEGVMCQVENQYRSVLARRILPQDRARLGFREEKKETFRGGEIVERLVYGVRIRKDNNYTIIRSAQMTQEERATFNVREPEEAARIEAEMTKVHGTIMSEAQRASQNDLQYSQNQAFMQRHEARERQLKAEEAALKIAQAKAQREAQIEAQRLAEERMVALKEEQLREREIAAQERIAAEMARIRQELEIRRVILGR